MAIYIVTYDINHETAMPKIAAEIDATPWVPLSESSYAVETEENPEQLFKRFSKHLDENDHLLVLSVLKPFVGRHRTDVLEWLQARMPW